MAKEAERYLCREENLFAAVKIIRLHLTKDNNYCCPFLFYANLSGAEEMDLLDATSE